MKSYLLTLLLVIAAACAVAQIGQQGARYAQDGLDYYNRGDYDNAIRQFLAADRSANGKVPQYHYWLGRLHIAVADTSSAKDWFARYLASGDTEYQSQVEAYQRIIRRQAEIFATISLSQLPDYVNSRNSDYGAFPDPEGKYLYFTSMRPADNAKENIWRAEILRSGFGRPELVKGLSSDKNEAIGSIAMDNSGAWIFGNYEANKRDGDIYWVPRVKEGWGKPENARVFNTKQVETHPFVFRDRLMFFASSREGGYGGMDIYVSEKFGGAWSEPRNLGPTVNTSANEQTPFLDQDGRTLFFASNGHPGFGGYDIFRVYRVGYGWQDWSLPENLGLPMNSTRDDRHFFHVYGTNEGYLSSDRTLPGFENIYQLSYSPAGEASYLMLGENGEAVSVLVKPPVPVIRKPVTIDDLLNKLDQSLEVVKHGLEATTVPEQASIAEEPAAPVPATQTVRISGVLLDEAGDPVSGEVQITCTVDGVRTRSIVETSSEGVYQVFMPLSDAYAVTVNKTGFVFYSGIAYPAISDGNMEYDIELTSLSSSDPGIFPDLLFIPGSSELAPDNDSALETILLTLLANPKLRLMVTGHADDAGSSRENKKLGEKRAKVVIDYLVQKGIAPNQLTWSSKAEDLPLPGSINNENQRASISVVKK